ncbi:MAG: hypothetical protein FWC43_12065 [Planctomycetaceae bacterium]|nr:hypothetical protein [Planctomycetaceae bacterium]
MEGLFLGILAIVFCLVVIVRGIATLTVTIKQLPDQLIEKLRKEENRKLFERNSDQKSE